MRKDNLLLTTYSKNVITLLKEAEDLTIETVCGCPLELVIYSGLFNECVPKPGLPSDRSSGINLKNKVLCFFLRFWFFKSKVLENILIAEINVESKKGLL
jgi:hypothetical protein